MAQRQRARDRVIQAIGPARIGQVPESVFRAQVDRVAHIAGKRGNGLERHQQRLGRAGGAGGEHHQEGVVAPARHRLERRRLAFQFGPEAEVAAHQAAALVAGHGDNGGTAIHVIQLGAVGAIGDHNLRAGRIEPVLDGLGAEGREQRLVHRAGAPGAEDRHQQLGVAR
ncbi:hypothetical protein D3C72_1348120 [compost metagenome]